jgi:hypothetical protein
VQTNFIIHESDEKKYESCQTSGALMGMCKFTTGFPFQVGVALDADRDANMLACIGCNYMPRSLKLFAKVHEAHSFLMYMHAAMLKQRNNK